MSKWITTPLETNTEFNNTLLAQAPTLPVRIIIPPRNARVVQPSVDYFIRETPKMYYPEKFISESSSRELIIISFILLVCGLLLIKLK